MNIKRIEKEMRKELLDFFSDQFAHVNNEWLADKVMKVVREYVKQVVESVPNIDTQEIKQWKKRILKELKEEK